MKAFVCAFYCESNSFSPLPCGWESFREQMLYAPYAHPDVLHEVTAPLWVLRKRVAERGWRVVEGTCAYAKPCAPVQRPVYEAIRDEILEQLRAAMPLDMVVLSLHGAMMADGYLDCEGDLARRAREIVGPDVALGMLLDPHCHLSAEMVDNCDAVVLLKEAPHVDFVERSEELIDLLEARVNRTIRLTASVFDCRMVDLFLTTREPMRSFVDEMQRLEQTEGVLSISLAHGMELGDSPDMGTRVLVYTDGRPELGAALAETLGRKVFELRGKGFPAWSTIAEAVDVAAQTTVGPIALADASDNPGAGAAGDSTFLLAALRRRGVVDVAAGPLWDPIAVRTAFEAGVGGRLAMRIGGKMGPNSGDPIDADVEVIALEPQAHQTWSGTRLSVGRAAVVRFDGIDLIINDVRTQVFGPDLFTNLGVDPECKKVLLLKATAQFVSTFGPMLKQVLFVAGPGSGAPDPRERTYRFVPRPLWPLDERPFG
jgi:microcystin degradation protein MlrC